MRMKGSNTYEVAQSNEFHVKLSLLSLNFHQILPSREASFQIQPPKLGYNSSTFWMKEEFSPTFFSCW